MPSTRAGAPSIVVAQLAFIGDMVFTTPLFDEIKRAFGDATLTVVGRPAALEPLADHRAVDAVIAFDKDASNHGVSGLVDVGRRVRAARPDVFLGVSRSLRTALLARLSRAPKRVGFAGPARRLFYDVTVARRDAEVRFPERPLALLRALGIDAQPRPLSLAVGLARQQAARARLEDAGWRGEPLIAIAPGANYATKRWPEAHYAALLDRCLAEGRMRPALYGGELERATIERLLVGRAPAVLDRRGVSLADVAAEFTLARAYLSGDTGPAHIARALGVPVVAIFGPTNPDALMDARPFTVLRRGLPCQPCSPHGDAVCPLRHHRCMLEIEPDAVYERVLELVNR